MANNMENISSFRFITQKILPLVYDESLSYYEFLCKVLAKLNETLETVNEQNDEILAFKNEVQSTLNTYIVVVNTQNEKIEDLEDAWEEYKAELNAEWEAYKTNTTSSFEADIVSYWEVFRDHYAQTLGVVQTTGISTTDVMSQKASTDEFNGIKSSLLNERLFQLPEIAGENLWTNGDIEYNVTGSGQEYFFSYITLPAGTYCFYYREKDVRELTTPYTPMISLRNGSPTGNVLATIIDTQTNFTINTTTDVYLRVVWSLDNRPPVGGAYHGYIRGIKVCAGAYTGILPDHILPINSEDLTEINQQMLKQRMFQLADLTGTYVSAPNDEIKDVSTSESWGQLISDIPLGNLTAGNYCLYARDFRIDDFIVDRDKIYIYKNSYTTENILVSKQKFDFYNNFTVDETSDIYLRIYWSINNVNYHPASNYTGYIKGMKLCENFYTGKIPTDKLDDSVTGIGLAINGDKRIIGTNTGTSVSITVPQLKKNFIISYHSLFDEWADLTISQGKGTGYTEVRCVISSTDVKIYKSGSSSASFTEAHNLTLGTYITVNIEIKENNKCKIYICSNGQTYTSTETTWWSYRSNVLAEQNINTDKTLSWGSADFLARTWLYGDSYFDHWLPKIIERGYTNFLEDGYSGGTSANAYASLQIAIQKGVPHTLVWCLGMNSPDNTNSINATWKYNMDRVKTLCDNYGINLIVTTIPNVSGNGTSAAPARNHTYKNAYIRENFNYIDLAKMVGSDISNEWYSGLLSSDGTHPSTVGDFFIANIMQMYLPDLNNF